MTYFAVGWSLIPFIRADGYWALCDVLGFKDLERPFEGPPQRGRLVFLLIHRTLNIVFLGLVAVLLPVMWAEQLAAVVPPWSNPFASVLIPGLVLLLWGLMGRRIYILIGLLVGDLRRKCFTNMRFSIRNIFWLASQSIISMVKSGGLKYKSIERRDEK